MKRSMGVVHILANCTNCSWSTADYLVGKRLAAEHARLRKHKVSIEVGTSGYYDGRAAVKEKSR